MGSVKNPKANLLFKVWAKFTLFLEINLEWFSSSRICADPYIFLLEIIDVITRPTPSLKSKHPTKAKGFSLKKIEAHSYAHELLSPFLVVIVFYFKN